MSDQSTQHIWHPFTQMQTAEAPIHIAEGKGSLLFDKEGNQYIDGISSWWVNIHGHANKTIAKAIAKQAQQLEQVIFAGFTHTPAQRLAKKTLQLFDGHFGKVFFSDNGSTAVEVAVKMALQFWHNRGDKKKTKIIALENAYHGDTFGAMSVGARSAFNAPFEKHLFETVYLPVPRKDNLDNCIAMLQKACKKGDVAAMIYEPLVQGSGGMIMYEAAHLDKLLTAAKKENILCIADEVMTGYGRTGKLFASEYLKQKADIICLSKGLTGGFLPMGLTLCTDTVYKAFLSSDRMKTLFHGHSYTANPLACAAALASLKILKSDICRTRIETIALSHKNFAAKNKKHPALSDIRVQGTILALEFKTNADTSYFNTFRDKAYRYFIDRGILLRPLGNIIYFMPPYCTTEAQLKKVYKTLQQSLTDLGVINNSYGKSV